MIKRIRNAVLAAVLVITAAGMFVLRKGDSDNAEQKRDASLSPEQKRTMESRWIYAMSLPPFGRFEQREWHSIGEWPTEKKKEALDRFKIRFGEISQESEKQLVTLKGEKERGKVIADYLSKVIQAYKVAVGDRKSEKLNLDSARFAHLIQQINDSLIPLGAYLHVSRNPVLKTRITQYRIIQTGEARVENLLVNVAYLSAERNFNSHPDDPVARINGVYQPKIDTAVLDVKGADLEFEKIVEAYKVRCLRAGEKPRDFDTARTREDFRATSLPHEMTHAYLTSVDYESERNEALVRRNGIPMGTYDFPREALTQVNNAQIHELFANGIGLMKSGEAAPLVAHGIVVDSDQPSYVLAQSLIRREIVYAPGLDPQIRESLKKEIETSKSIPIDRLIAAINRLSAEDLHLIGKRLAEAAQYLMGK